MNEELLSVQKSLDDLVEDKELETIPLFPGIDLMYVRLKSEAFSMKHKAVDSILQINYCKSGQIVWRMENGNRLHLRPGDFSLHMMNACTDSAIAFPTGEYSGLTLYIDLRETAANPPELLKGVERFAEALQKKFCRNCTASFLAGNEWTEEIFSGFYGQPEELRLPYQRIKALELILYLDKLGFTQQNQLTDCQVEMIREIHNRLIARIGERITIEELSKEYLINPTTLKCAFKAVYGTSLAAHMKEHRMKMAAEMLRDTNKSIAEIAQAVGYDSQSKFAAAFKNFFQVLPKEYKKKSIKF